MIELVAVEPFRLTQRFLGDVVPVAGDESARDLIEAHRLRLLRLGAAAELWLDGKSIRLLPAAGIEHEAGKIDKLGDETNRARESAIIKRIIAKKRTAFLVLGGGHDLTESPSIESNHRGFQLPGTLWRL